MIEYQNILDKNMLNVFKDILINIREKGLSNNNHLYVTFATNHQNVKLPNWLIQKYPKEMTIVIQYEYWNFKVKKNSFSISLSFNDVRTNLTIPFESVVSFVDPYANFGLKLIQDEKDKKSSNVLKEKNNIVDFSKYKKN